MKEEIMKVPQSTVAQALAADYFCIYYVNTDNDKFIEYSSSEEYKAFNLPDIGDDFMSFSRRDFERLIYPDDRELFLEQFTKENVVVSLDAHGTFTMTFRMVFNKKPTHVHLKITRMIEKEGRHIVVGISSVDEQVKAREAFEKAHHDSITYSRIAQALAEDYFCIYYVNLATDEFIEYSSDKDYKALGMETGGVDFFEMIRKSIPRVVYEDDQGTFLEIFTKKRVVKVLDEHKTFTFSYRLILNGEPTYVNMKVTRMKDDDGNHIIVGINNIDALMRQQARFKQAEADRITYSRVAQALAGDYFSIYIVDLDTDHFVEYSATEDYEVLGMEKAGEDFFNLSRKNMERVIFPGDKDRFMGIFTKEKILAIMERDGSFTMKYRLMVGETPVFVSMKATLLEDKDGRHLIIGTNNINAQMSREEEYRKNLADARNRAKNDFLANMSHDIRTPMNAIVGYTNIARSHMDDPEVVRDSLEKIGSSSHFLLSLINDVLDMSKIESGKMQLNTSECNLEAILQRIEDIMSMQAKNKSLRISYDRDRISHYRVCGDELRIEQVLINIISNAIKYTPENKSVYLVAEEEPLPDPSRSRYRFIIRDTGVGISEEYLPNIFESFTREQSTLVNKIQGTGLGLAITAKVVELMGGTISVKSKLGEGSEFTVEIDLTVLEEKADPCSCSNGSDRNPDGDRGRGNDGARANGSDARAGGGTSSDAEDEPRRELNGEKILLVEDHDINAEIAIMILSQYGLQVDRAENGQAGLDRLQEAGEGYYDAVLMDIQMPVMNGYDATCAIRALEGDYYQSIPIIAMSANAYDEDVRQCLDVGMNAHIAKPFDPEVLYRILCKYIKK